MSTYQMVTLNGQVQFVDSETGEPIEILNDEEISFDEQSASRIWKKWSGTELGSRFYERFYHNSENQQALIRIFTRLYPDERVTISRLNDAFESALLAGCFVEPKAPEPAPPTPRDANGKFMNPHVADLERMLKDPLTPSRAITERMRTDRAFREAIQAASRPEPQRQRGVIPSEEEKASLRAFASSYRTAKSLRPLQGRITLSPTEDYSVADFNELVERASQFGLL